MSRKVNENSKYIIEEIFQGSSFSLKLSNIKNIDYLLEKNIGIKVIARDRKGKLDFNDSIYIKKSCVESFYNECKDNNLIPYFCYVQLLENYMNIFMFNLEDVKGKITSSGLNINIKENDIKINKGIYNGVLWRFKIKRELFGNDNIIKDNMKLIYSGDQELKMKLELEKLDSMDINSYNNLLKEIDVINSSENLNLTEKEQLVKARIGQSKLRELLINRDCKCKICGLNDERFLIASHIKRWAESNERERVDLNNAFLLCPDHDWLFDKFYISFNEEGDILLADNIDKKIYEQLKTNNLNKININTENKKYLKWHREKFYNNNK